MNNFYLLTSKRLYDSIHRNKLWKCMEEIKIPKKLINVSKSLYKRQEMLLE